MNGRKDLLLTLAFATALATLPGCVGGTLGNTEEFEMFPLRSASESESRGLKRCLLAAHNAQAAYMEKKGSYARKPRELNIDSDCHGLLLAQRGTPTGYEIRAELRESETTVRWSVNEEGLMEEHLDGSETDPNEDLLVF